jgi:hypothetical protein
MEDVARSFLTGPRSWVALCKHGYDSDGAFSFGLNVILDGLDRLRA